MLILNPPSWDVPCDKTSNLQITPEESPELTPKRKRPNTSPSPPPWNWDWDSTPSPMPSSSSLLLSSPLLSPLSTHPNPESIPSFNPKSWLSAAKSILHSAKAKTTGTETGTGTNADPASGPILKSLEDTVWIVNEEITGIETMMEEMRCWDGISVREVVEIVEEAEGNIWACLERARAEIAEMHGGERNDRVKEAIQCLLAGRIGEVDVLLEGMNT